MTHQIYSYPNSLQPIRTWLSENTNFDKDTLPSGLYNHIESRLPPNTDFYVEICGIPAGFDLGKEWVTGFPHKHTISQGWPADAMTYMMYVDVPILGGEVLIGGTEIDDPYELIVPQEGMIIVIDADTYHGVKPVVAGTRTAIMLSTVPRAE